jgi:hypothetical protein
MLQPSCDICGQPATIHDTAINAGEAVSRHRCQEHGESLLTTSIPGVDAASLPTAEELYQRLSESERKHFALLYRLTRRGV